jgi:hypothetical protein
MKKLAVHDFEDIAGAYLIITKRNMLAKRCIIQVFEGLLPELYNGFTLDLLWEMAHCRSLMTQPP